MAETTTISGRPNAAPLDGSERVIMDQGDDTVDASTQDIANLAPGTDLDYAPETRTLTSSTGEDVQLPLATVLLAGLMSAAAMARLEQLGADDSPSFAGLTITGTAAVAIPHIHGALAGPSYIHVKNTGSVTLPKGTPVYTVGTVGDTTTLEVQKADSANPLKMPAVGLLDADLAPNDLGHAIVVGELTGAPTAGYAVNAPLYVAAGGGVTATRPTTGIIQQVAIVGRANASTGSLTATIGPQLNPLWDTAYSERLQWNGGSTGLDPAAGRASLLLGSAAQASTGDFASAAQGTKADSAVQPATLSSALSTKADLVGGVVPTSQIPAIAISDYLGAVGSQAAMLALVGQRGDWCLRTDPGAVGQWILGGDNAALLANWVQIPMPVAPVQSVNGQTGIIVLAPGDIGAATAAQGTKADSALQPSTPIADGLILVISNRGEVATASTNYAETLPLSYALTLTKITFITHTDSTGTSTTTLSAYKRTAAGVKTTVLSANATLVSGASAVVASLSSTPGVLSVAAGERLGVDLIGLGTGASGIQAIFEFARPAA